MNDIERIGVGIDTTGIEAGTAALDKLADAGPKVDAALRTVEGAVAKTGKSLASLGAGSGDGLTEAAQKMDRAASTITEVANTVTRAGAQMAATPIIPAGSQKFLADFTAAEQKFLASLQAEYAQLGMNRSEVEKYLAAQSGFSESARAQAAAIGTKIDAWHREEEAARAAAAAQERVTSQQQAYIAALKQQAETTGMTRRQLAEYQAAQLGISKEAQPFIDRIHGVNQAMKGAGVSAGQTAAAMGQLPAQIQDFIIQIQGGQSALTALAQQGSQVATSFGGVGNALRAVGSLISPTVAIAAAAAVTVGVLAKAYNDGASEAQAYSRALILSGNAAGTTAAQLQAMAAAQSKVVGTQSQAADALAQLAATGRVAGTQLSTAAEAAVRFARVGGDVGEVVKKFSDLGKEPLEALKRLNDSENFLTLSVYKQVKALTEQGRLTEAAKVAQDEYARVTIGRSKEIEQNLGALETAWKGIKDGASAAWDAMLGIGRRATVQDLIKELEQQLEAARSRGISISKTAFAGGTIGAGGPQPFVQVQVESTAEQLRDRIEALREVERLERRAADAKRDGAAAVKAQIKADEDAAKALAKANAEREREAAALERAIGLSGSYYKDLAEIGKLRQQGKLTEEQYIAAVQKLITEQPKVREQVQAEAEARKASQKVLDDQAKAYERTLDAQIKSGARVEEQIQKFKDENDAIGLAASQNISLAAAVELVHAARRKEALDTAVRQGDYLTASYLEDEIKKRKELAGLINSKDAREAAKKSAEDAAREWQRASEAAKKSAEDAAREWQRASGEIERTLTDALMRGFESGKSFASTLRDTVVNMFKTMVLRPVVSAIVSPVAGALAGSLGFSAAASAAGAAGGAGGFGALSAAGAASAMYPLLSNFGLAAQNFFTNAGTSLFNMGAESAGNFLIGNAGNLGYIANSLGTGLSYLSSIKALADGRYGAGLLGGAGTFLGGPIGGLIGNVIGGAIDKVFGGAGTHHAGAGYVSDGTTGQNVSNGGYGLSYSYGDSVGKYYSQGISDALKGITTGSASLLNDLARSFGGQGGYQVGAYFASDNNRESQGSRSVLLNGQTLSEWSGKGLAADAKTGLEQLTNALAGDLRAAIDTIDLPGWAREQFAALSSDATIDQLAQTVQAVNASKAALVSLGEVFPMLARLSDDALSGLVKAAGGVQALSQSASAYYENFYSDTEKTARATDQVRTAMESLGLAMPATREAFRALVEAQDLSTEAGQKQYAALLQLSPAFAALVPATVGLGTAAETAAETVDRAAEQMAEAGRRALADLASQRGSLEVELLRAQGDITGALSRQREQDLARITEGLSSQDAAAAVAAYDLNAALQAQIEAANEAAQAVRDSAAASQQAAAAEAQRQAGIEAQRNNIQAQIDQLLGDTEAIRARELNGLDVSNRDLMQRYYDIYDAQQVANAAAQEAQRAAQQQAQEAQRAAQQQAQAAEQQARAAEQVRDAWRSVGDSLLDEASRIRQSISGNTPESLSQAEARFAIASAQARAGDVEAAKLLPGLAQAMLTIGEQQSVSLSDLQSLRNRTAGSLEMVANMIGATYGVSAAKAITGLAPAAVSNYAPAPLQASSFQAQQATQSDMVSELELLRKELIDLRKQIDVSNANTERAARALEGDQSSPILVEIAP